LPFCLSAARDSLNNHPDADRGLSPLPGQMRNIVYFDPGVGSRIGFF
jgi:hypothetical protein